MADGYDDPSSRSATPRPRHGPDPGPPFRAERAAYPAPRRARSAAEASGSPTTQRPALGAGELRPSRRPRLRAGRHTAMHHRHLEARCADDAGGAVDRPAYYGARTDASAAIARGGARRARRRRHDRRHHAGRTRDARTRCRASCSSASTPSPMTSSRSAAPATCCMTTRPASIIDDGVACRFARGHILRHGDDRRRRRGSIARCCSWNAAVADGRRRRQRHRPPMPAINIAGPQARAVLREARQRHRPLGRGLPLSWPCGWASSPASGPPAARRLRRRARLRDPLPGRASAKRCGTPLMEAGGDVGIRPFGVEAQRVLRLEKGHIIVGQDTDGLTFPLEADMEWAIASKKPFFVGQRAIEGPGGAAADAPAGGLHPRPSERAAAGGVLSGDPRRRDRGPGHLGRALGGRGRHRRLGLCPPGRLGAGQPVHRETGGRQRRDAHGGGAAVLRPVHARQEL